VNTTKRREVREPRTPGSSRTWAIRAAIAIGVGFALGIGGGIAGVNRLEPGRPGQPDSLQLMLDSLQRRDDANAPMAQRRAADSLDAALRAQRIADSVALANDPDAPVVPDVVRMEEGAARQTIEDAGLMVGSVIFRTDSATTGTVLATMPAAGRKVRAGTAIDLVLSDGRTGTSDTAQVAPPLPSLPNE
jgi:hypothetical protein